MEGATGRIVWLRHRVGATVEGEDRERLAELAEAKVQRASRPDEMAELRRIYEENTM
jgi:hypothetical protein